MRIVRWLVLISMLAATSCSEATGPEDFAVVTSVSATSLRSGGSINVTVTFTNRTDSDQMISAKTCPPKFSVLNAAGAVVGPAGVFCTAELKLRKVAPGESVALTFPWTGQSSDSGTSSGTVTFLSPGAYRVRGFEYVEKIGRVDGSIVEVTITP